MEQEKFPCPDCSKEHPGFIDASGFSEFVVCETCKGLGIVDADEYMQKLIDTPDEKILEGIDQEKHRAWYKSMLSRIFARSSEPD